MYIPRNKYKIENALPGEFTTSTGQEYFGPVIKTSSGIVFKGGSLEEAGERLVPAETIPQPTDLDFPFNDYVGPTESDITKGRFNRFILQNTRTKVIKEVNEKRFYTYNKLPNIKGFIIPWNLTKPVENTAINGYLYEGSKSKNEKTIQSFERQVPGISNFLDPYDYLR